MRRLALGLSLVLLALHPFYAASAEKPNVVLILADDLGWNDVGYHGSEIQTPNIDRIASQGVELDRFYAFPMCSPTRTALMTGRSPIEVGITRPITADDTKGLPLDERIMPQYFKAAGYQTRMSGKWHLGMAHVDYFPHNRGFDSFYGHLSGGIGYWSKIHTGGYDWQRDGETLREGGYTTHLIAAEAVRLLEHRDLSRPTFLYVSFNAPHTPNEAPQATLDKYAAIQDENRRAHAAMVDELDQGIGRVLTAIEAEGMQENTVVFFMSDNGGASARALPWLAKLALPQLSKWGADNTPFRGGKTQPLEGGVRVPAAVWWPGRVEGGRKIEQAVSAHDVLPTLAAATGIPLDAPKRLYGVDRWPVIAGDSKAEHPGFVLESLGSHAVFRSPWKLVYESPPPLIPKWIRGFLSPTLSLYNLADDPYESHDVADRHPDILAELKAMYDAIPRNPLLGPLAPGDRFGGSETRPPWAEAASQD